MRSFHTTSYKLYKNGLNKNLKILIMSDIHFSYKVSNEKLNMIIDDVKKVNPDYVFIAGDLVDSLKLVEEEYEKNRIIDWIRKLSEITRLIIIPGNHDFYYTFDINKWLSLNDSTFFKEISEIPNVEFLNHLDYEDSSIYVTGFSLPFEYYHPRESKELLLNELEEKIPFNMPNDKLKFFLFHSPVFLKDKDIVERLKEYDYFISGHMHNGIVPPILDELWLSDKGIISPNKGFFIPNTRNTLIYQDDKLIVNGSVTTFHQCTGKMQIFNILFPIYNTVLEFTSDEKYNTEKVYVKKEYHK